MNRIQFTLLGAGLVASVAAWSEEPAAEERRSPPERLIVMAWNIHHGEGEDGRLDLERIADVIKKAGADIVLLQEVDDRTQRTGRVPQIDELARLTGLKAVFGKAMDFQGGGYGNAVLTRWAPVATRVMPLPGGGEPRCALEVTIQPPGLGDRLTLVSTHLDVSSAASRADHAQQLATEFLLRPHLVILGGDFNATPEEPPLAAFTSPWLNPKKNGTPTGTIPSAAPTREIDFILLKPAANQPAPTILRSEVVAEKVASDHRPIIMELRLPLSP